MKLKNSMEQAICLLIIIAHSNNEKPLKSYNISDSSGVSDSYLKKVTRQLVVSGLITSKASKLGGFVLNKNLKDISLFNIFEAIEGKEKFVETTHLVEKVFDPKLKVKETEDVIVNYLNTAEEQYKAKLKEITLAHIIEAAQE